MNANGTTSDIKLEDNIDAGVSLFSEYSTDAVTNVKEEPEPSAYQNCKRNSPTVALLYKDHDIKEDIAIGPTVIQKCNISPEYVSDCSRNQNTFFCEVCGKEFTRHKSLEIHLKIHLGEKINKCALCNTKYMETDELKKHIMYAHFLDISLLKYMSKGIQYMCDMCNMVFDNKNNLIGHITKTHCGGKIYSCKTCKKTFKSSVMYNLHMKEDHNIQVRICQRRMYLCNVCSKECIGTSAFKRHMRVHTGEKPFSCSFCNKPFAMMSSLKRHELVHTGEKPFPCNFCEKQFADNQLRKLHQKTHTGEKPYACRFCDKRFIQLSNRKKHELIHTGHKPFSCNYCSKRFSRKDVFKEHQNTHTKEGQFPCSFCDRRFTRKFLLNEHERTHTGEKPFSCRNCDMQFARKINLRQHEHVHIGDKTFSCS